MNKMLKSVLLITTTLITYISSILAQNPDSTYRIDSISIQKDSVKSINKRVSDSLVYKLKIEELTKKGTPLISASIIASQDLASAGLFSEALEILLESDSVQETPVTIPSVNTSSENPKKDKKRTKWHIYASADYNQIIDTTPDEKKALDTLIGSDLKTSPWSEYVKAGLDYTPVNSFITGFSPDIYISDQKSYAQIKSRAEALKGIISLEGTLNAEHIYDEAIKNDMADFLLKGELTSAPHHLPYTVSLPLTFEICRYKTNTTNQFSYEEYVAEPTIEWTNDDLTWSINATGESGYRNSALKNTGNNSTGIDSIDINNSDLLYTVPTITVDYWRTSFSAELSSWVRFERYPGLSDPNEHDNFETDLNIDYKPFSRVECRLDGSYGFERQYSQSSVEMLGKSAQITTDSLYNFDRKYVYKQKNYMLQGSYYTANPLIKISFNDAAAFGIRYQREQRMYPPLYSIGNDSLANPLYIWESYHRDIPAIGFLLNNKWFDGEVWINRETDTYDNYKSPTGGPLYTYSNSQVWGITLRAEIQVNKAFSVDCSIDYQNRSYEDFSVGMTGRF